MSNFFSTIDTKKNWDSFKVIKPWTKEQTKIFLNVLEERNIDPIFQLIVFTGLRKGEALGLKWEDIDLERGKIRVIRSLARPRRGAVFKRCYDLFITNMVSSFYHYMTQVRGAFSIEVENTVQIVDTTNI